MRNILILGWLIASTVTVFGTQTPEVKRVILRPEAETAGPRVLLGEVADVRGFSEGWRQRLTDLDVGAAALPGQARRISRLRVEAIVGSEYKGDRVYVLGSGSIEVTTRAKILSGAEIIDAVQAYIDANSPWSGDMVRIEFRKVKEEVVVPDRGLSFRIEPVGDCDFIGYSMFNLLSEENGKEVARVPVACNIRVFRPVLVSTTRIDREESLDSENISLEDRELTELRGSPLPALSEVDGLVATRIISPGRILTNDMVGPPIVLNKGDQVLIEALAGRIVIRLPGSVDQAGRVGEFISVRSLSSGKRLEAKVIDGKKVRIVF